MSYKQRPAYMYIGTGISAIVVGGIISAFCAKNPSTLAMWASAYLVLVVGVVQVFFGIVIVEIITKHSSKILFGIFGMFNVGNCLVVASTIMKYGGYDHHVIWTMLGSFCIMLALVMLSVQVSTARASNLKMLAYVVISILLLSLPIGLLLAADKG